MKRLTNNETVRLHRQFKETLLKHRALRAATRIEARRRQSKPLFLHHIYRILIQEFDELAK